MNYEISEADWCISRRKWISSKASWCAATRNWNEHTLICFLSMASSPSSHCGLSATLCRSLRFHCLCTALFQMCSSPSSPLTSPLMSHWLETLFMHHKAACFTGDLHLLCTPLPVNGSCVTLSLHSFSQEKLSLISSLGRWLDTVISDELHHWLNKVASKSLMQPYSCASDGHGQWPLGVWGGGVVGSMF